MGKTTLPNIKQKRMRKTKHPFPIDFFSMPSMAISTFTALEAKLKVKTCSENEWEGIGLVLE